MKTKTNIKAGRELADYLNQTGAVVKATGQKLGESLKSTAEVVTTPKFWTWPW